MRLLIAGGGTGGHLWPALAVAQAFHDEVPDGELLLVGRTGGPEERLVPEAGFDLRTIRVRGFDRDAWWRNAALPGVIPAAFASGSRLVKEFRPDMVLGVGGYVMAPALFGARLRGVPYVLQVSEAEGLANRFFRSGAAAACVSFEEDCATFKTRATSFTGYPVRQGFRPRTPEVPPRRLLVIGGSQGARRLNRAVWEGLDQLLSRFTEVLHLHGPQGTEEAAALLRPGYRPMAFNSDIQGLMAEADLVLARSGVGTCAELGAVGLPAILVPGTFGGGHQAKNAARMVAAGAAVVVPDEELSSSRILSTLDLLGPTELSSRAAAAARLGRPQAAREIVRTLLQVAA